MAAPILIPAAITLAAQYFPALVTKVAGQNAAETAERIVRTAARAAGLPGRAPLEEILRRLNGDPAAADRLRLEFERLNQAEHERILEDRADARAYQAKVGQSGRLRGNIMLVGVVLGLGLCVGLIALPGSAPDGQVLALLTTVSGALLKMLSDAFAFEFGSSRGSKEKDAQVNDLKEALIKLSGERSARSDGGAGPSVPKEDPGEEAVVLSEAPAPVPRRRDLVGELMPAGS